MKTLLSITLLLISGICYCQEIWTGGTVILNSNDTLNGEILYMDWKRSPESIKFRSAANASERELSAKEVKRLTVHTPSEVFEGKTAEIAYYSQMPVAQGASPIDKTVEVSAFFEVILSHPRVTLYRYTDEQSNPRFFLLKGDKFQELHNVYYNVRVKDETILVVRPRYREEIKLLLSDCKPVDEKRLTYNAASIIKYIRDYLTGCNDGDDKLFEQTRLKNKVNIGVFSAGLISDPFEVFGASIELISEKNFQRYSALIDLGPIRDGQKFESIYLGINGVVRLVAPTKAAISPTVLFGVSTVHTLNAGVGLAFRNGSGLTLHRSLLGSRFGYDEPLVTLNFRLMFTVSKKSNNNRVANP